VSVSLNLVSCRSARRPRTRFNEKGHNLSQAPATKMRRRPDRGSTRRLELGPALVRPCPGSWPKPSRPQLRMQSPPGMRTPRLPSADDHLSCRSRRGAARCGDVHGDGGAQRGVAGPWPAPVPAVLPAGLGARTRSSAWRQRRCSAATRARERGWPRIIDGIRDWGTGLSEGWRTWRTGTWAGAGSACR
jgi:hypothetical protein